MTLSLPFSPPARPVGSFNALSKALRKKFWDKYTKERVTYEKNRSEFTQKILDKCSAAFKINHNTVTLYFEDEKEVIGAVEALGEYLIMRVTAPRSPELQEKMRNNPNSIFRPTLFHNKYIYRIKLRRVWGESRFSVLNGISNMFGGEVKENKWLGYGGSASVTHSLHFDDDRVFYRNGEYIYVNHEDDIVLLNLAIANNIEKICKVELTK